MILLNNIKYINFFSLLIFASFLPYLSNANDPLQEQAQAMNRYYEALVKTRQTSGKVSIEQENKLREEHVYPADKTYMKKYAESYYKALDKSKLQYQPENEFKKKKELAHWNQVLNIKNENDSEENIKEIDSNKKSRKIAQKKSTLSKDGKSTQAQAIEGGAEIIQFPAQK